MSISRNTLTSYVFYGLKDEAAILWLPQVNRQKEVKVGFGGRWFEHPAFDLWL